MSLGRGECNECFHQLHRITNRKEDIVHVDAFIGGVDLLLPAANNETANASCIENVCVTAASALLKDG